MRQTEIGKTVLQNLYEAFIRPEEKINRSTLYENKIWINKFKNR